MRTPVLGACALVALTAAGAAQTSSKISARMECAKPEPAYALPVADAAAHVMILSGAKCTYTEGTLAGEKLKDEQDTFTSDATGGSSEDRGYGVGTLANGDKYVVHIRGTTKLQGDKPVSGECKWKFIGGTGKLKGITGKGTCKGTFQPDGKASWQIEGEYTIGAPAKS